MRMPKRRVSDIKPPEDKEVIRKAVKLTLNKGQFIVRIPRIISEFLELSKDDKLEFLIEVAPHPKSKDQSTRSFRILRGGKDA